MTTRKKTATKKTASKKATARQTTSTKTTSVPTTPEAPAPMDVPEAPAETTPIFNVNRSKATIAARIDGSTLTLDFSSGQRIVLLASALTKEIQSKAMMHGLKQKLVDAGAISRNPVTGAPAFTRDKYEAIKAVYDRLTSEEATWNATRQGSGGTGGMLLKAIVRMYPDKTEAQLTEFLAGKTAAQKTALRNNPRVAEVIAKIREESGNTSKASDDMLNELGDA